MNFFDDATICRGLFGFTTIALSLRALFAFASFVTCTFDISSSAFPWTPRHRGSFKIRTHPCLCVRLLHLSRERLPGDYCAVLCFLDRLNRCIYQTAIIPKTKVSRIAASVAPLLLSGEIPRNTSMNRMCCLTIRTGPASTSGLPPITAQPCQCPRQPETRPHLEPYV